MKLSKDEIIAYYENKLKEKIVSEREALFRLLKDILLGLTKSGKIHTMLYIACNNIYYNLTGNYFSE